MSLADYTFYAETYLGNKIPSESFSKYINKANYILTVFIQKRLVEDEQETQYNLAACEIAEYYYDSAVNDGKSINSESVGNYSVSYTAQPYREMDIAMQYLGNTGLLATGVYCN